MVYCFVPYCPFAAPGQRFGAKPEKGEKVAFFQPPQGGKMGGWGEGMFEMWKRKLPRPGFTRKGHVCEKHFLECEIDRYEEVYLKNGTVRRTKLDQPQLSSAAHPMIFPSPPAISYQEKKIEKKSTEPPKVPKRSAPVVPSSKRSSAEIVPNDASIESTSAFNSVSVKIPRLDESSLVANPPNSSSSSGDSKIRRSLRRKAVMKYSNAKAPTRSCLVIVPTISPTTETEAPTNETAAAATKTQAPATATTNTITLSSVPSSDNISLDSNSKQVQPYDHVAVMEDLQKIKMDWPEWSFSYVKQQGEELILLVHIDPTSGLLDKYVKIKKTDLSVKGFFTSVSPPLSCLPIAGIRNKTDIHHLLSFMTNVKVTFEKK